MIKIITVLVLFCFSTLFAVKEQELSQPHLSNDQRIQHDRLKNAFLKDANHHRNEYGTTSGFPNCEGGDKKDKIKSLPGLSEVTLEMYSGFIEVNATANGSLFYWFIVSQDNPTSDDTPVLVWLNGGPGASSLTGLFMENGPYRITEDGNLTLHNATWNKYYHMLFIDNPIGTGFSFCNDDSYVTSNAQMAEDFLVMLDYFFSDHCHSEYKNNPLYITGESYAGRYIPFIGKWIQSNDTKGLNLTGLAIGNGIYDPTIQFASAAHYAFNFGILDEYGKQMVLNNVTSAWDNINSNGPNAYAAQVLLNYTNAIYGNQTNYYGYGGNIFQYNVYVRNPNFFNAATNNLAKYLAQDGISDDIHTHGIKWKSSDGTSSPNKVDDALYLDIILNNSAIFIPDLLKSYRLLFYNGQLDGSICNNHGNQKCLQQLNYQGNWYNRQRYIWETDNGGQEHLTAGYIKQSDDKKLTYVVISDSGHLVPYDQPDNSLRMIKNWVEDVDPADWK